MILVDTSVWVDHLRRGREDLAGQLMNGRVVSHEFVIGELACGNLRNRAGILAHLRNLAPATVAHADEALHFIERRKLMGRGLSYVDVHLLASSAIEGARLWTLDKALHAAAADIGLAFSPG